MQEREVIERIKALCKVRSWTTYRLAKESGITYSTLCTMLHKSNSPSIPTLAKICNGFGISLAQFFDADDQHAILTPSQFEHLALWDQLSDENKEITEKYMSFLISQQSPSE